MGGNEQDVVERQRFPDDTHATFSYAQKRIIPASRRPRSARAARRGSSQHTSSRRGRRRLDARPRFDYLANVINPAARLRMSMRAITNCRDARDRGAARSRHRGSGRPRSALPCWHLAAAPASAAIYKWTDANGRVVYSDQPPPANVKVEAIAPPPPPANPNAVKELARQGSRGTGSARCSAPRRTPRPQRRASTPTSRREQCGRAARSDRAAATNESSRLPHATKRASRSTWTTRRSASEREQLELWIRDNCLNAPG